MKKYIREKKNILNAVLFVLAVLSILGFFQVTYVFAGTMWDLQQDNLRPTASVFGSDADNPRDVRLVTANIIKVFLTFVGIILIIMIIAAGVRWMTAAGNAERVAQARKQLINAIIGVIIILASYAITDFLADCVFDVSGGPSTIWMCH